MVIHVQDEVLTHDSKPNKGNVSPGKKQTKQTPVHNCHHECVALMNALTDKHQAGEGRVAKKKTESAFIIPIRLHCKNTEQKTVLNSHHEMPETCEIKSWLQIQTLLM